MLSVDSGAWAQQPAGQLAHSHAALAVTLALALSALLLRKPGVSSGERRRRHRRRRAAQADASAALADAAAAKAVLAEDPCAVPLLVEARGASTRHSTDSWRRALPRRATPAARADPARRAELEERVLRPRAGRAAVEIVSRTWELPKPKAVTLLVHGLNGHARHASNMWTAHTLLNAGFSVVALDVEGHGLSGGVRGFVPNIEQDVAGDVAHLLLRTRARYPTLPLFLMGNSMGGLSAALSALALQRDGPRAGALLSGVVLQCPLIRTAKPPSRLMQLAASALAVVAPKLPLLPPPPAAAAAAAARMSLLADELCYSGRLRVGTGLALLRASANLASRLADWNVPLLLQHGLDDALVAPHGSRELLAAAAATDKTLIEYQAGHNLLAEPATLHAVRKDYLQWLETRADASWASSML